MSFCYEMYYFALEKYIGERFLEDYLDSYSQKVISTVAKESLIPYNLTQSVTETLLFHTN